MDKPKRPKAIAASRRQDAERAAEHWLRNVLDCIVTRRAVRTQWHKVDFFAADVVGKSASGAHCYAQATAGSYSAVTSRRRKLEKIPWHPYDSVFVLQLIEQQHPAKGRWKQWFFRVHEYEPDIEDSADLTVRRWRTWDAATEIPKAWFKAWKDTPPPSTNMEKHG